MGKISKQYNFLKFWIIIVMIIIFSFYPTFAVDKCDWTIADSIQHINVFFWNLWRLCSWIWILLWNIAWILMTNTMVYWEFMWLDTFLWKIWQISRSMANYALWAMFIYSIFKYIFFQKWEAWSTVIKNMLVTSVLIQSSWFLVMALVDLSTIALATVSAFPSQVVSVSETLEQDLKTQICRNYVLSRKGKDVVLINAFSDKPLEQGNTIWATTQSSNPSTNWTCDNEPDTSLIDSMLPQPESFWGTFMYLWFTALNAQDYMYKTVPLSSNCVDDVVKTVINIVLDAWMLILYSIALAILVILLIMRLWYLWIFIAISPIIVLVSFSWLFKLKSSEISEILDYKKALFLIFQPVIFAFWMSLMFLFVIVIQWLFSNSPSSNMWESIAVVESKNSSSRTDVVPKISSSLWNSWVIDFTLRQWSKSLKDILLSFLILILMWQLVKLAVSWEFMWFQWIKSINKKINSITDSVWRTLSSVKVIPAPWGKKVWFREVTNWNLLDTVKNEYIPKKYRDAFDFDSKRKAQKKELARRFWLDVTIESLDATQTRSIERSISNYESVDAFPSQLKKIKEDNGWLKFSEVKSYVNDWIKKKYQNLNQNEKEYYFGKEICNKINNTEDQNFDIASVFEKNDDVNGNNFSTFYNNVLWWMWKVSYRDFIKKNNGEVR